MAENKFCDNDVIARCVPMSKLQSVIGGITQSTLTKQLRELEGDGFLHREVFQEIPPRVEYSLTALGQSFIPVLQTMMAWSETHLCPDYENPYQV